MSRANGAARTLHPEDVGVPQYTPTEADTMREAMHVATLDLIRSAAASPVQLAQLAASLEGLQRETRDGLSQLRESATRTEALLGRLVTLGEEANRLRAQELEEARETRRAREEAARWWRSLITPQGVLYLLAVAVTIVGALLGVGQLMPPPRVTP